MREIIFTHQCGGDLGIGLRQEGGETQCIAMVFFHSNLYPVYDIVEGGFATKHNNLASALNFMLERAEEVAKQPAEETPCR